MRASCPLAAFAIALAVATAGGQTSQTGQTGGHTDTAVYVNPAAASTSQRGHGHAHRPSFSSTYLTIYNFTSAFDTTRWRSEMQHMRAINVTEIIIAGSVSEGACSEECKRQGYVAQVRGKADVPGTNSWCLVDLWP